MRPETALARTAAKGCQYTVWTPATSGVTFTAADAAHALGGYCTRHRGEDRYCQCGVSGIGTRLLLIKFGCGDDGDRHSLAIEVAFAIESLKEAPKNSGIAGIGIMRAVVEESLSPGVCPKCDGRGWIKSGPRWDECVECERTGRAQWSMTRRARECGVDRATLRNTTWGKIYEEARKLLISEELIALDHMARRLRGRR